jgi:hypothetical protein
MAVMKKNAGETMGTTGATASAGAGDAAGGAAASGEGASEGDGSAEPPSAEGPSAAPSPAAPLMVEMAPVEASVGQQTLEMTPQRAMLFLFYMARSPEARRLMAKKGFGEEAQREGVRLVQQVFAFEAPPADPRTDEEVRAAGDKIDDDDEDIFRVGRASLVHKHPAQAAFLFNGIGPSTGAQSVINMSVLLGRIEELRSSPARASTRAEDQAALDTLARRGLGPQELDVLAELVRIALSAKSVPSTGPKEELAAKRQAALVALRVWYEEWSELARASIKRRDLLQNLGLARRVRRGADDAGGAATPGGVTGDGTDGGPSGTPV